ncbi:hypothetical protein niasHT_024577 [Heterodera trifolii]|uniref:Uncharacterized protein n=1 Tax=Heterodera trifolii TaxID=157864 RepID=A0ABD2K7E7_9BILA
MENECQPSSADESDENPPADENDQNPSGDESDENPPADENDQNPSGDESDENPPADENDQNPSADESDENPPADENDQNPPADENDQNPPADRNDENPADAEDNRTMIRKISLKLYRPNLAQVYTVNLGKIDPPELYFNRTIFVAKENDLANYHALLYAQIHKIQQNSYYNLLGYAQLIKTKDKEEASASSQSEKKVNAKSEHF